MFFMNYVIKFKPIIVWRCKKEAEHIIKVDNTSYVVHTRNHFSCHIQINLYQIWTQYLQGLLSEQLGQEKVKRVKCDTVNLLLMEMF
jgi:hypothetical protein